MASTILVAEDESTIIKVIEFKLKKDGYNVLLAADGMQAKEIIAKYQPDLILTDIMMPFFSGLELITYTRKELGVATPIIILSAVGQEDTVVEAFKLGADDFITKPFSPNELSMRVKKYI